MLLLPVIHAQEATHARGASDQASLEEIIVTAQKREQSLQDVGVAVTALGERALDQLDTNDVKSLTTAVPSLQVQQYSPSLTVFNIRGVAQNDFGDLQEGPIAFYNDEVYIGSLGAIAGQTFDLQRVEVLRGPQGTLFGRNATGGLIQAVTAKPTANWEGYATLTGGEYKQLTTEAAISGPLSDSIRFRLAETTNHHDGYYHNAFPGGEDGGNAKFYAARGQIEFDVGSKGLLRVKAEYMRNDHEATGANNATAARLDDDGLGVPLGPNENYYGTCPGCTPFGFRFDPDVFVNNLNFPGQFDRTYLNLTARYEQDFGAAQLTSITSYQDLHKFYSEDTDATPLDVLQVSTEQNLYQLSQELRLSGETNRLNWVTGLYGMKIHTKGTSTAFVDPVVAEFFTPPAGVSFGTFATDNLFQSRQDTKSFAAFAQGEYRINDVFTAIAGARYSVDWKKFGFVHSVFGFEDYDFVARRPDLESQKFSNWSGKLQLQAKVTSDILLYAGVNRGTKAGGFNTPNVIPNGFTITDPATLAAVLAAFDNSMVFGQEELTNYEGGFKLTLADNRVALNGSVFHYDYHEYQSFQQENGSQFIVNLPAKVTGAELELVARPHPRLNLSGFVSHMFNATVHDVQLPGNGFVPGRFTNTHLPQAPDWSVGAMASLEMPIGDVGALTLGTNWKYDSSQYFSVYNPQVSYEKSHVVGNVRISFMPPSKTWELALFVNNVTDEIYRVFNSDNSFTSTSEDIYGKPRWYGGSMTYHFGR